MFILSCARETSKPGRSSSSWRSRGEIWGTLPAERGKPFCCIGGSETHCCRKLVQAPKTVSVETRVQDALGHADRERGTRQNAADQILGPGTQVLARNHFVHQHPALRL